MQTAVVICVLIRVVRRAHFGSSARHTAMLNPFNHVEQFLEPHSLSANFCIILVLVSFRLVIVAAASPAMIIVISANEVAAP